MHPDPITTTIVTTTTSTLIGNSTTDTATALTTITETSTATSVSTTPTTETTATSVLATSTIPAPPGFLPIQSTLPNSSYISGNVSKRDVNEHFRLSPGTFDLSAAELVKRNVASSAICTTLMTTLTTSISATSTSTATVTLTSTILTTFVPLAHTTTTNTITHTITAAITSLANATATQTWTIVAGTTTVYAACATNNFANVFRANGTQFAIGDILNNGPFFVVNSADSAYACCVDSFTNAAGAVQAWSWIHGTCYQFYTTGATCVAGAQTNNSYGVAGPPLELYGPEATAGNSCLGEYTYVEPH